LWDRHVETFGSTGLLLPLLLLDLTLLLLLLLQAVIELQLRMPNARILYVSATGASEAENLCYMERLGLWGPGAAFPSKTGGGLVLAGGEGEGAVGA
jgi:hypothetical protein